MSDSRQRKHVIQIPIKEFNQLRDEVFALYQKELDRWNDYSAEDALGAYTQLNKVLQKIDILKFNHQGSIKLED